MISFAFHLIHQYPELLAVALAIIFSIAAGQALRMFWFQDLSSRQAWRVISIVEFLLTATFGDVLWHLLDADRDLQVLRIVVSLGTGFCTVFIHMIGLRFVAKRWPWADPDNDIKPPPA